MYVSLKILFRYLGTTETNQNYINKERNCRINLETVCYHTVQNCVSLSWFLVLKEEHRLRVYENTVLRIFGPEREEITEGWKKLHYKELSNVHS
jgi:hypothetical protein